MGKKTGRHVCYIVVDSAGKLEDVDPIRAAPDSVVLFIMSNEHATNDMKVEIKDFKRKETMTPLSPIATGGGSGRSASCWMMRGSSRPIARGRPRRCGCACFPWPRSITRW